MYIFLEIVFDIKCHMFWETKSHAVVPPTRLPLVFGTVRA